MEAKKLILIIDDEADFADLMRIFLENANFRVITALSPMEGLEKAGLKPDMVLLDLNMPGVSGHEVCRRIKENKETADIPVIMLTSQDRTLDKVEALNLGAADYIGKNFPLEEILARIKAALREAAPRKNPDDKPQRNRIIVELRNIIDESRLHTLFQPIVEMRTRKAIGYEALTRGPKGSALESPLDLFALANEENMFLELDKLCLTLAASRANFIAPGQILFLNTDPSAVSADYFKHLDFLKWSSLKPAQLCIEITERTCIKNFAKLSAELNYFKPLGVKVAIDDAGEGYASLKAIAELKPDFIKIDMSIIRNIDSDEVKRSIAQSISGLAANINSRVIAEGIETEPEYLALLSLGVEYGQGYLFARPSEEIKPL